ncbi:MAG: DUF494 domain-containing protein [Gammaproteobacteria bacterium]|nr:MAG: DUF494 domain-containing protein [Gammaproteobacteria bacterium]
MKDNVFDVLMYLFERYNEEDADFEPDRGELQAQLLEAGFEAPEVDRAFDWLDGLANSQALPMESMRGTSMRVYSEAEHERLDARARGFLTFLEQAGVLDPRSREVIIDRAMALDEEGIDLDQLKWVSLMVLFNQPEFEGPFHWLEEIVFDDRPAYLN